jgi:hypothetical protein
MAAGGKFGLVQGISIYAERGQCLVPPRRQNRRLLFSRDSPIPAPHGERLLSHRHYPLGAPFAGRGGAVRGPESS